MNWQEKFQIIQNDILINKDIENDFYIKDYSCSEVTIQKLNKDFPFITKDFNNFLKLTDGADIAQCRIIETSNISLIENYTDIYKKDTWFPFGWDAGGRPLLLHKSGKVAIGENKVNKPIFEFIAQSFSNFLNDVLLGQNYPKIYSISEEEVKDFIEEEKQEDPWLMYLIEKQWLKE